MNNPKRILGTLDRHLERPTRIILYGRAALALGFPAAADEMAATLDVDAILPGVDMAVIESDSQFWRALELTNRDLEPEGLYITHLFPDDQVILSVNWLMRIVPLPDRSWRHLLVYRLATIDLLLSKMMRDDPQDLADISFLLEREPITLEALHAEFADARVPEIPEIRDCFATVQPKVLQLAARQLQREG